jgi:hypothetical protein
MKFSIDDKVVFELSGIQEKVLKDNIFSEEFEKTMGERIKWVIERKYDASFTHLKKEWMHKLYEAGVESVPLNDEKFAKLVFSQPNYKARSERDKPMPKKITK